MGGSIFDPNNQSHKKKSSSTPSPINSPLVQGVLAPGASKPTGAAKTPEKLKIETASPKPPVPGANATSIDARIKTAQFTVCQFAGNELAVNKLRKCKHFEQSPNRGCCIWYREEINVDTKLFVSDEYAAFGICTKLGDEIRG